jgi:drug/metabolite transporter (DMT)-like permease
VIDRDRAFVQPRVLIPFILVTLMWGSTWLVITSQIGTVPAAWSVTYRFMIAAAAMFAYAALAKVPLRLGRGGHLFAAAYGIPLFCLSFNSVYIAERYVTSGLVAVIFALLIVPNSLLAWLFLKHRLGGRFVVGSLVAIAGVALLFVQELRANAANSDAIGFGIALSVLAVLMASASNVVQAAERVRTLPLAGLIAWGMSYSVIPNALFACLLAGPPVIDTSPAYLGGLFYLALFASTLAFPLYFVVIRAAGPGRAAYSNLLIPIIAMALSTVFEDYRWTPLASAGGLLGMTGLIIVFTARRDATADRPLPLAD